MIYLDHHATTPCDPRVLEAMLPTFSECFANAASRQHAPGREAAALVERARGQIARLIGADSAEIIFTSGATEADNLAIKGVVGAARAARAQRGEDGGSEVHIVTSAVEHKAVLDSCESLEKLGCDVTYLRPDGEGRVSVEALAGAIRKTTALVSIQYANNETGVVQPVAAIGSLCKEHGILFHCDAVQALAYLPCSVAELGIDLLSLSAHKMYGPKGVGALYVRRRGPRVRLQPLLDGGGHERGMRSGTLNVPGIVGFGVACEVAARERERDSARIGELRDLLLSRLREGSPDVAVNGSLGQRLPINLNVSFPGVEGEALVAALPGVAVSTGAACTSASFSASYVLKGMGLSDERVAGAVRFGLGRFTTHEEIEEASRRVLETVEKLRRDPAATANACAREGSASAPPTSDFIESSG